MPGGPPSRSARTRRDDLGVETYAAAPITPVEHIERVGLIADAVVAPLRA